MKKEENHALPVHVALILDGNGRWAKAHFLPRNAGHAQGSKNVEKICEAVGKKGIKYLTVYAFSTENWNRPKEEVDGLMKLLRSYLTDCLKTSKKNNMRVRILGNISMLAEDIQDKILTLERESAENTGLNFQVALNYGGRDEILRAMEHMKEKGLPITEENLSSCLDTAGIPDPDLIIRTSGEQRLSNFLLWQSAYSELYFTETLWPDFNQRSLEEALEWFQGRKRRFGGV